MKKNLKTEFSTRQYMLSRDFEVYYYSDRNLPDVKIHTHDYYEFYFFLEGDIIMYIGDRAFSPKVGTMVIIPPKTPHLVRIIDKEVSYRRFVFWITEDFLASLTNISKDYGYVLSFAESGGFIHKFSDIEFNTIQGKMFSLIDETHAERFAKDAKILVLLSDFMLIINRFVYEAKNHNELKADDSTLYQSIMQYIETHIDEDLSLDALSKKFHVSKFHLSHLFTDEAGLSIHKYITKKRLSMCLDAILSGHEISDICSAYGFTDYSVFYRAFVKEYGKSPKKYRDEILRNSP